METAEDEEEEAGFAASRLNHPKSSLRTARALGIRDPKVELQVLVHMRQTLLDPALGGGANRRAYHARCTHLTA